MYTKQTSEMWKDTNNHINTCCGCRRIMDQSPQTASYSKQNFEKAAGQNLKRILLESESRVSRSAWVTFVPDPKKGNNIEGESKDAHASQPQMTRAPSADENHQAPAQYLSVVEKIYYFK
jgi:hypothetical protein